MGKGGGCFSSKPSAASSAPTQQPAPTPAQPQTAAAAAREAPAPEKPVAPVPAATAAPSAVKEVTTVVAKESKMPKVYLVYYSLYGHVLKMIEAAKEGLIEGGVEAEIYQVPETLPAEVLEKMHAPPKADYPIATAASLPEADGFIFGFPTRFGLMAGQMKSFFDSTGQLWQAQALAGKPAGIIVSTASQGGGQETTALTAITQLTHHGIIFVPTGYTYGGPLFDVEEVRGGSAYGAGTFAGPTGARQPSEKELGHAKHQGKAFAAIVKKLAA